MTVVGGVNFTAFKQRELQMDRVMKITWEEVGRDGCGRSGRKEEA